MYVHGCLRIAVRRDSYISLGGRQILIDKKVKLATVVVDDPKFPFSIVTTLRGRVGCYLFPWITHLYP